MRIANPIYAEVVPRELGWILQEELDLNTTWYVDEDGELDLDKLLGAFQDFFRRHSEHWKNRFLYEEAWPQILLQAYLHRVVNGGGRIEREYGLGRGRVDLLIAWPQCGRMREYVMVNRPVCIFGMRSDVIAVSVRGSADHDLARLPGADGLIPRIAPALRGSPAPRRAPTPRRAALSRSGGPP